MTTKLVPYLNFPGNTREALTFYQSVFGGELILHTFAQFGVTDMPADGIMHGELTSEEISLAASDAMPGDEAKWGTTRIYLAVMGDDLATQEGWFTALAEGGEIVVKLERQVWDDVYGQVKDRFGMEWMFNITAPS
ncbi:PhnB protein [Propionicimonas paludicola]|uniref:PhnB protein n=1 Tax=Propionicimonas paludicola TaxID=185243 RepID=A0A2A9CXI9_9ACTN|nr:VOC family protein [Propionicimonas paludicola]PFG18330.1 PhnB protein [Propionicimonas paludicola]